MELPEGYTIKRNKVTGKYRWKDRLSMYPVDYDTYELACESAVKYHLNLPLNWEDVTNEPA